MAPVAETVERGALPKHLVQLPGSDWRLWRCVCVRGAGFPAAHVLTLADAEVAAAADACLQSAEHSRSLAAFAQTFESHRHVTLEAARRIASGTAFQEAVIWQNRRAFHTGVQPLLRARPETGAHLSSIRQHARMVASYLQRYCVKNDTIGFFGPVGWASIERDGAPLSARPGRTLIATRDVYFEHWGIQALADVLANNDALKPWIAPRRLPFVHVDGDDVRLPDGSLKLSGGQRCVLDLCDGATTAIEIAEDLVRRVPARFAAIGEVYRFLKILVKMGLVAWDIALPLDARPERILRRTLERTPDREAAKAALRPLAELEAARSNVAQSAGDVQALDRALAELDDVFTRVTGHGSTRHAGMTYAGRTLVYEDCRRDLDVTLGPDLLEALAPPLSLLLASARWFTFEAASEYRSLFNDIYDRAAKNTGSSVVDALHLLPKLYPFIVGHESDVLRRIGAKFQNKWSAVLNLSAGQARVRLSADALRPRIVDAFAVPQPGWRGACYHSPDVMIAAASVEAIQQGQYDLVLGELHLSANSLGALALVEQHPSPVDLFEAAGRDMPQPGIVLVPPREWLGGPKRTSRMLTSPNDVHLEVGSGVSSASRSRTVPLDMFTIVKAGNSLVMESRDGSMRFDLIDALADTLVMASFSRFKLFDERRYIPRVSIDRLIICRESWRLPAASLPFAQDPAEANRFLGARRWAKANGVPRWVFVRAPVEVKPFFVDFESPIYVDLFAKVIRRTIACDPADSDIVVSEMLPRLDQLWLEDAQGQRYTSELRIVAVDQSVGAP